MHVCAHVCAFTGVLTGPPSQMYFLLQGSGFQREAVLPREYRQCPETVLVVMAGGGRD